MADQALCLDDSRDTYALNSTFPIYQTFDQHLTQASIPVQSLAGTKVRSNAAVLPVSGRNSRMSAGCGDTMPAICLHNKDAIEAVLRRDVGLNFYALGDLDDEYWPHTTWYAWPDRGDVEAIALLYSGQLQPRV